MSEAATDGLAAIWIVLEPYPGPLTQYPLNTGEVARITGTSAKQVRTWEASRLLPAYWIAGRRRFFSAALVNAFLLKNLDRNDIRCIARILTAGPDDPLPELVAAAIEHARHNGRPVRLDMLLSLRAERQPH